MPKKIKSPITKRTTFIELINEYPEAGAILFSKGLHCIGCHFSNIESIEDGALAHGMNPDKLVEELNEKLFSK